MACPPLSTLGSSAVASANLSASSTVSDPQSVALGRHQYSAASQPASHEFSAVTQAPATMAPSSLSSFFDLTTPLGMLEIVAVCNLLKALEGLKQEEVDTFFTEFFSGSRLEKATYRKMTQEISNRRNSHYSLGVHIRQVFRNLCASGNNDITVGRLAKAVERVADPLLTEIFCDSFGGLKISNDYSFDRVQQQKCLLVISCLKEIHGYKTTTEEVMRSELQGQFDRALFVLKQELLSRDLECALDLFIILKRAYGLTIKGLWTSCHPYRDDAGKADFINDFLYNKTYDCTWQDLLVATAIVDKELFDKLLSLFNDDTLTPALDRQSRAMVRSSQSATVEPQTQVHVQAQSQSLSHTPNVSPTESRSPSHQQQARTHSIPSRVPTPHAQTPTPVSSARRQSPPSSVAPSPVNTRASRPPVYTPTATGSETSLPRVSATPSSSASVTSSANSSLSAAVDPEDTSMPPAYSAECYRSDYFLAKRTIGRESLLWHLSCEDRFTIGVFFSFLFNHRTYNKTILNNPNRESIENCQILLQQWLTIQKEDGVSEKSIWRQLYQAALDAHCEREFWQGIKAHCINKLGIRFEQSRCLWGISVGGMAAPKCDVSIYCSDKYLRRHSLDRSSFIEELNAYPLFKLDDFFNQLLRGSFNHKDALKDKTKSDLEKISIPLQAWLDVQAQDEATDEDIWRSLYRAARDANFEGTFLQKIRKYCSEVLGFSVR